jgi:hypothetical protein
MMVDESCTLAGRYGLGAEVCRDVVTITYTAEDLLLNGEIQVKVLVDYDPAAVLQFDRSVREAAAKFPSEGEMAILDSGKSEDGRIFAVYAMVVGKKAANSASDPAPL